MNPIDPYELIDKDYNEFLRIGRETYGIAEKETENERETV